MFCRAARVEYVNTLLGQKLTHESKKKTIAIENAIVFTTNTGV